MSEFTVVEDEEGERLFLVPLERLKDFEAWQWDVNDDDIARYDVEPVPYYAEEIRLELLRIKDWGYATGRYERSL